MEEKPALGVMPCWLHTQNRICELAEAISKNAVSVHRSKTDLIRLWAKEILLQCDLLDEIESH